MVSAVSTESAAFARTGQRNGSCYVVPSPVRVRKEAFGLLFYNTEDANLTFVKSGDLLQISALPHGAKTITVPGTGDSTESEKASLSFAKKEAHL
jgi:putative mycofactocin binding protein MftB